jgi:hypothetical protein
MACVDACFHGEGAKPGDVAAGYGWSVEDAPSEARPFEYTLQAIAMLPPFPGDPKHPRTLAPGGASEAA